jgi:hypothetical protein
MASPAGIANIAAARTTYETLMPSVFAQRPPGVWSQFTALFNSQDGIGLEIDEAAARPVIQEWTGMRVWSGFRVQKKYVGLKTYQAGFKLPRKDVQYDKTGIFGKQISAHLSDTAYMPDKLVFESLLSNPTGIDGVSLLNDSHPNGVSGGTWDNKVTTALSYASVNTGIAAMKSLRDENGEYLGIVPDLLIVGTANERTALEITGSDGRPVPIDTAGALDATTKVNAAATVSNVYKGRLTVIVSPRFEDGTNTASWLLADSRFPFMGWLQGGGGPSGGDASGARVSSGPPVMTTIIDQPNMDIPAQEDMFAYGVAFDARPFGLSPYGLYGRLG